MIKCISLRFDEKKWRELEKEKDKSGLSWENYFLKMTLGDGTSFH